MLPSFLLFPCTFISYTSSFVFEEDINMPSTVRIVARNANGLIQRPKYWNNSSGMKNICGPDTRNPSNREYFHKIGGYKSSRPDKVGKVGTAVVIKENMRHSEYETSDSGECSDESLVITLAVIYCPPGIGGSPSRHWTLDYL